MKKKFQALSLLFTLSLILIFLTACPKKQPPPIAPTPSRISPTPTPVVKEKITPTPTISEQEIARRQFEREMKLVLQNIHFEFDKATLTPEARAILKKIGAWLLKHPNVVILIEGHCDERGSNEYNLALGERRAASAKAYLVSMGVSPDRIKTISYGEERPLDPRHNEEAWAKNRRDEFKVISK